MTYISSLSLTAFRSYDATSVDDLDDTFIVLIGENGVGKTNALEAVSILSPGRGLRSAPVAQCQSNILQTPWVVSASIADADGYHTRLGVGIDPIKINKKIIRANGTPVKNQEDLGDILRTVWLTPQMDGLFLQSSAERRRFFDRLVTSFDGSHTGRMTRYDKAMRERLNLLKNAHEKGAKADTVWLDALENIMAETSIAIAAARIETKNKLQNVIFSETLSDFPSALITLNGSIETALENKSALSVEDLARDQFLSMRLADGQTGRTNFGIQRTDMSVTYIDKNVNAALCSTGEQKALLTTIILAHARMVSARYGHPPLLLFDEIAAHFDERRRCALFELLTAFKTQIWLSGQNNNQFDSIKDAQILTIKDNKILR